MLLKQVWLDFLKTDLQRDFSELSFFLPAFIFDVIITVSFHKPFIHVKGFWGMIFVKEFNFTNIRLSLYSGQPSDEPSTAKSFPRSREQHPVKMVQR